MDGKPLGSHPFRAAAAFPRPTSLRPSSRVPCCAPRDPHGRFRPLLRLAPREARRGVPHTAKASALPSPHPPRSMRAFLAGSLNAARASVTCDPPPGAPLAGIAPVASLPPHPTAAPPLRGPSRPAPSPRGKGCGQAVGQSGSRAGARLQAPMRGLSKWGATLCQDRPSAPPATHCPRRVRASGWCVDPVLQAVRKGAV